MLNSFNGIVKERIQIDKQFELQLKEEIYALISIGEVDLAKKLINLYFVDNNEY